MEFTGLVLSKNLDEIVVLGFDGLKHSVGGVPPCVAGLFDGLLKDVLYAVCLYIANKTLACLQEARDTVRALFLLQGMLQDSVDDMVDTVKAIFIAEGEDDV